MWYRNHETNPRPSADLCRAILMHQMCIHYVCVFDVSVLVSAGEQVNENERKFSRKRRQNEMKSSIELFFVAVVVDSIDIITTSAFPHEKLCQIININHTYSIYKRIYVYMQQTSTNPYIYIPFRNMKTYTYLYIHIHIHIETL